MCVCAIACLWTLWYKPHRSMYLQRLVLVFPVLKALHTLIITANMSLCYDQTNWETANKYLIMGLISFETLFETVLLTIFLVLAKGWGIIRFYVMRDEATHVTIALGTVYLHYSAFFVTIEIPFLNKLVKVKYEHAECKCQTCLIIVDTIFGIGTYSQTRNDYIFHCSCCGVYSRSNFESCAIQLIHNFSKPVPQLLNYFIFQFDLLATGAYNLVIMHNELVSLSCICCLLYALRSREWPPYFQLNVYPLQFGIPMMGGDMLINNNGQGELRQRFIPNILEMNLRRKDYANLSQDQSFDSRSSNKLQ